MHTCRSRLGPFGLAPLLITDCGRFFQLCVKFLRKLEDGGVVVYSVARGEGLIFLAIFTYEYHTHVRTYTNTGFTNVPNVTIWDTHAPQTRA